MFHSILLTLGIAGALGLGTFAMQSESSQDRADCPGLITCPESGELICADQCPLDEQQAIVVPPCCRD